VNTDPHGYADAFDKRKAYIVDVLRRAADAIEADKYSTVVHPITGGRRRTEVAAQIVRAVTGAVTDADLPTLVAFAATADLDAFPQTQEM
jgi:hypothetical protein